LLEGLSKCRKLRIFKLYMGETGMTRHSAEIVKHFNEKQKIHSVRICGDHVDINSGTKKKNANFREELTKTYINEMQKELMVEN